MKKVTIQNITTFVCEELPTTESDGEGQIVNKWDLLDEALKIFNFEAKVVGKLFEYTDGSFSILHPPDIRYHFTKKEVVFCNTSPK